MWSKLAEIETIGDVPPYLIIMFERFGLDTPAAFSIGIGKYYSSLIERIEEAVRSIGQSDQIWDSTRKQTVVNALKIMGKTPTSYSMPYGHKLLLKAIRDHYKLAYDKKICMK